MTPAGRPSFPFRALLWLRHHLVPVLLALLLLPPLASMLWLIDKPDVLDNVARGWTTLNYFIGYDTGFGGRKLVGTVCRWLWGDAVGLGQIMAMATAASALMMLLLGLFLWRALPVIDRRSLPLAAVVALYMVSPMSVLRYVQGHPAMSIGCMETYQFILVLVWLLLYLRHRGSVAYWAATLATPLLGLLVHHTFMCTFMPLYVALAVADLRDGSSPAKRLLYGVAALLACALFVALWRFSTMNVGIDELYGRIEGKVSPGKEMLRVMYYVSNEDNRRWAFGTGGFTKAIDFALMLLMMLPLVAVLWQPWVHGRRPVEALLSPAVTVTVLTLPIFVMATDYGRWWTCYFFCLVAALCARRDDPAVARNLERLRGWGGYIGTSCCCFLCGWQRCMGAAPAVWRRRLR